MPDRDDHLRWCMPSSVLNALWGSVMARIAATVWRGQLKWPPETEGQLVHADMYGFPVEGDVLDEFWETLARISFGSVAGYKSKRAALQKSLHDKLPEHSELQRAAHLVLSYFDPKGDDPHRIRFRVIKAHAYDFVLSSEGIDVFIPPDPFVDDDGARNMERGRAEILRMYKFRETGKPPIGLPGLPATGGTESRGYHVPISQLTNPTGSYQIHEDWARGQSNAVQWWLTGSAYRGMMHQLPRVIASLWYESVAWPPSDPEGGPEGDQHTIRDDFEEEDGFADLDGRGDRPKGLRRLLEQRTETRFPRHMAMDVLGEGEAIPGLGEGGDAPASWDACDVMITNLGLHFPDPGMVAPDIEDILDAIESGVAGNPVFTDSGGW